MKAKAGDKISEKARKAYAKALGGCPIERIETVVALSTNGIGGQWFCIDCGALPENNLQAQTHNSKHRLAWRSTTSNIEEP